MKKIKDILQQCLLYGFALFACSSSLSGQSVNLRTFQDIQLMTLEDCAVVQINASWNYNSRLKIEKLKDCYVAEIDLMNKDIGAVIKKEWKISVVPTIIIFEKGVEKIRFEAGISMKFNEEEILNKIRREIR
jgi:hypothetical protein